MYRLVFVLLVLVIAVGIIEYRQSQQKSSGTFPTPTPTQTPSKTVADWSYALFTVSDLNRLQLIPNYSEKVETSTLKSNQACQMAINGGFYDTNDLPLGLVIVDGEEIQARRSSQIFDGFFSVTGQKATIATDIQSSPRLALQTGPLLLINAKPTHLSLTTDKSSRRMVAATTPYGLAFITLYSELAPILGPHLVDLPDLVASIAAQEHLNLQNAINLDGGRASAFYTPELALTEIDPVGSLFCVK